MKVWYGSLLVAFVTAACGGGSGRALVFRGTGQVDPAPQHLSAGTYTVTFIGSCANRGGLGKVGADGSLGNGILIRNDANIVVPSDGMWDTIVRPETSCDWAVRLTSK